MGTGVPSSPLTRTYFSVYRKVSKRNFNVRFAQPFCIRKLLNFNTFLTSCQLLFLVTRGRIELPFAAWEAAVLAAWPTGHNSKTFGLCFVKEFSVRPFQTSHRSFLVHHHGLEPWTHWLRVSCSTNWANGAYFLVNKKVCKENFTERFRAVPSIFTTESVRFFLYTFKTEQSYSQSLFFIEVT